MSEKNFTLPNKLEIEQRYESYRPAFNEILGKIENLLKQKINLPSNPTYKARIKSFPSYYKKILRQKAKESSESNELVTLTDMIGIRVICAFVEDLALVEKQVVEFFDVKEIERKGADQSFKEFGYQLLINIEKFSFNICLLAGFIALLLYVFGYDKGKRWAFIIPCVYLILNIVIGVITNA